MSTFEWPCDRRDAHHEHPRRCDKGCQPDWHRDDCAIYATCPGVGAHPATQIGGDHDEW